MCLSLICMPAGLEQLLQMADYVISSAHFPQGWTGEQCLGDALVVTLSRLPHARWVITTLGSRGSVLLERPHPGQETAAAAAAEPVVLEELVSQLFDQAAATSSAADADADGQGMPACISSSGVAIHTGGTASSAAACSLRLQRGEAETQRVAQAAAQAAAAAAAANADAGNASSYAMGSSSSSSSEAAPAGEVIARVTAVQAARLPAGAVQDTTGAGDSFIGSMLYGLATGMAVQRAVQLATVVAACKCTQLGARPGLPRRSNLSASLLAP